MQNLIETARLRLEPFAPANLEALHALWSDPHVRKFLWDDVVIAKEAAQEIINASMASFAQNGFGFWSVFLKDARQFLGFCGLRILDETAEIEMLYGLWPQFWGKGFATEAAAAVMQHGFEICKLERLVAGADLPNVASLRVMERLGMKYDRQVKHNGLDLIYFALTRTDWEKTAAAGAPTRLC